VLVLRKNLIWRRCGQARRYLFVHSSSLDVDDDSDPMDFDNEVLDALAHLSTAPATSFNIKTFKSITPSAKSTPLAGQCSNDVCDSH